MRIDSKVGTDSTWNWEGVGELKTDGRIGSVPHSSIKFTWDIKWGHLLHMALYPL